MERAEPEQPPSSSSSGRFVAVGVGLVIVALGVAAGGVFRPIGTNVVDRSSAVSRAVIGLVVGGVVASAVLFYAHQRSWWKNINKPIVGALAVLGIAAISLFAVSTAPRHAPAPEPAAAAPITPSASVATIVPRRGGVEPTTTKSAPLPTWVTTIGLLLLIVVIGLLVLFIVRLLPTRRSGARLPAYNRPVADDEPDADAVDAALELSIDALLDDPDPRVAIKAAYAVLLDALAAAGFPRVPFEAPNEHLGRCLQGLRVEPNAMRHLLDIYAVARYSTHEVTEADRSTALGALRAAQAQLRRRAIDEAATDYPATEDSQGDRVESAT